MKFMNYLDGLWGLQLQNLPYTTFCIIKTGINQRLTHWPWNKMDSIFGMIYLMKCLLQIVLILFFKCIFLKENVWISIKISLKFVPTGPINNIPALVQIMAWRRPGDKPLSEPMMVNLLTHICVSRPQWVKQKLKSNLFKSAYIKHWF